MLRWTSVERSSAKAMRDGEIEMIDITGLREDKRPQSATIVHALLDRLDAAEKERDDVAQQLVQSEQGKRKISEECDALRAKIAEMERQEPVALVESWANGSYSRNYKLQWLRDVNEGAKLYALPGAQPAPSVPDVDALAQFIRDADGSHQLGAGVLAERIAEWLKAAPETKRDAP